MKCQNCGNFLENDVKFCNNCGAPVNYESNNINNSNFEINRGVDDELISAYIGQSVEDFKNARFSVLAFLFLNLYLFYRKMWMFGIIFSFIVCLFNIFIPGDILSFIFVLGFYFVIAYRFKYIYLQHAKNKVQKILNENPNASREQIIEICHKKGGKSILALIVYILIILLIPIIWFVLITGQIKDLFNNARKSAAEDTAYGILKAADDYVYLFKEQNNGIVPYFEIVFECDGKNCALITDLSSYNTNNLTELDGHFTIPTSGKVIIDDDIILENVVINGYTCNTGIMSDYVECSKSSKKMDNNKNDDYGLDEKESNKYISKTKIEKLSFDLLDKFEILKNDELSKHFSLYNREDNLYNKIDSCNVYTYSFESSEEAMKYLESIIKIDSESAVEVTPITDVIINGTNWLSARVVKLYNTSYLYVTKYDNFIYEIEFVIFNNTGICSDAHSSLINSLKFN